MGWINDLANNITNIRQYLDLYANLCSSQPFFAAIIAKPGSLTSESLIESRSINNQIKPSIIGNQLDLFLMGKTIAVQKENNYPDAFEKDLRSESYGVAVRAGENELLKIINDTIKQLKEETKMNPEGETISLYESLKRSSLNGYEQHKKNSRKACTLIR